MRREMRNGWWALSLCVLMLPLGAVAQPAHTRADVEAQWSKFTTSYIRANLKVGKTTVDQVLQSFGDPHQHDQVLTDKVNKEYFLYFKNPPKRTARALLRVGSAFSSAAGAIVPSWSEAIKARGSTDRRVRTSC